MSRAEHASLAELLRVAFEGADPRHRVEAFEALPKALKDSYGQNPKASLLAGAVLHAVLALAPDPEPAKPAPAGRVLYRDRDGDLWTCGADGAPWMCRGDGWIPAAQDRSSLAAIEEKHGPLHVVPWPGEVR